MIVFEYADDSAEAMEITQKLRELTLAHKLEAVAKRPLTLTEGGARYVGYANIMTYLEQLDTERKQWYYCNC